MSIRRRLAAALALATLVSLALPAAAGAAGLELGLKGGVNLSNFRGDFHDLADTKDQVGYVVGPFLSLGLGPTFAVQGEALFSVQGSKLNSTAAANLTGLTASDLSDAHLDLSYVQVPVLLRWSVLPGPVSPFVYAGPSFGFNLSGKLKASGMQDQDLKDLKSVDTGVAGGVGVRVGLLGLKLIGDARYTTSLASITSSTPSGSIYNSVWTLSAGVVF